MAILIHVVNRTMEILRSAWSPKLLSYSFSARRSVRHCTTFYSVEDEATDVNCETLPTRTLFARNLHRSALSPLSTREVYRRDFCKQHNNGTTAFIIHRAGFRYVNSRGVRSAPQTLKCGGEGSSGSFPAGKKKL